MSKAGGLISRFFGNTEATLPMPEVGTPTYPQMSKRKVVGNRSKDELERTSSDGAEVENLIRMPGWQRYYKYLIDQREKCRTQLATDDFGAQNDRLKAVQLRLATLEECLRWAENEVASGKQATEELTGGMHG